MNLGQLNSRTEQLCTAHHTIGPWGYCRSAQEFLFAPEKIKFPHANPTPLYEVNHLPSRNGPRICHIVDSERNAPLPAEPTGFHKLLQFGDRIGSIQEALVAH